MKNLKINDYLSKILLIIAGIVIAVLPQFLSGMFYAIGLIVLFLNMFTLLFSMHKKSAALLVPKSVFGVIVGFLIMMFPRLLSFGLPVIIGICLCIFGFERILKALDYKKMASPWIIQMILSFVITIVGIYFIFNPFSISNSIRRIIGILIIIYGIVSLVLSCRRNKNNNDNNSTIINIDDYSISDDDKRLQ